MGLKKLLIDSGEDFRQRSFGYGDDAPLITKELPGVEENPQSNTRNLVDSLTEGFIPGGALTAGERAITDTERISKFLLTGEGISFLATEVAGQRMNPQSLISPTNRTRTPLNLLAQIPSNIAGLHFRRDGVLDTVIENNYNYDFNQRGGKKYETELREIVRLDDEQSYDSTLKGLYTNLQAGQDPSLIREYPGGADSTFGIGTTRIKKYEDVGRPNETDIQIAINKEVEKIRGLSQYKEGEPDGSPVVNGEYNYSTPTVDKVNVADVFPRFSFEANEEAEQLKDFIKFKIALVDTENPLNDEVLLFRAFLESLNDNFIGNWNSYKYNGRAENFYTYNGFDREINFSFKVAPQSMVELKPLYRKLNYLVSSTAPEYVNRRMRGRYVRLTIGDWCYEVPGFFPTIGLSWTNNFPWETDPYDSDLISQHPLILNVNCTFKPIHDFTPESKIDKPFIIRKSTYVPEWPNPPKPDPAPDEITSLPPRAVDNNLPTPELQQLSQVNLNNAVTDTQKDIQFSRVYSPSKDGGDDGVTINYGYVTKFPELIDDENPNNIINHLHYLSIVRTNQTTTPPLTEAPYTPQQQAEIEKTRQERKSFGMF